MSSSPSPRRFSLSVKAVIRDPQGRVLVLRRSPASRHNAGSWEFPGGKIDSGETFDDGLLREVEEETGLRIRLDRVLDAGSSESEGRVVTYMFLEASPTGGEVRLSAEHDEFRWAELPALLELDLSPQFRDFAAEYCRRQGYGPTKCGKQDAPAGIDAAWLGEHVRNYREVRPRYTTFAEKLKDVLQQATRNLCPLALVSARPKSVPGFAEKIVRKKKYKDPLKELTDLCAARVVTQIKSEVEAVCRFVRDNFEIDEKNSLDAMSRLRASEFGYRSVHYVVRPRPGSFGGVLDEFHDLRAEIQVRTLLQHAWSDIGHDRLYKGGFKAPPLWERESARIAAALESADDAFSRLVEGLENYRCNFGAYLTPEEMAAEMEIVQAVLDHDPANPTLTHRLARLAIARDEFQRAVEIVRPFPTPLTPELYCCLGMGLCGIRASGTSSHNEGRNCFRQAIADDPTNVEPRVRLAETASDPHEKLTLFYDAYAVQPSDPGALAGYIRQRLLIDRNTEFVPLLRPSIEAAIRRCEDHVAVKVNIPWAVYKIAIFRLLLGPEHEWDCIDTLAHAVHFPQAHSLLQSALDFAELLAQVEVQRRDARCAARFLLVAQRALFAPPASEEGLQRLATPISESHPRIEGPVVIVAGGCDPAHAEEMAKYRDLLRDAFATFRGTIISGGTCEGISGLVGELGAQSQGRIRTIGYLPATLPADGTANRDERYELRLTDGEARFSALEPIQNWIDLLASGIHPREVRVLGINGGQIAAIEYRIAWALGAHVAVVRDSGREADKLEHEIKAQQFTGMIILPHDPMTLRAFLRSGPSATLALDAAQQERLARLVHARFLDENRHKHPDRAMRPWEGLDEDLRQSNLDLIDCMIDILHAAGFDVVPAKAPVPRIEFQPEEVGEMAEMEHGRWVVERLRSGWQFAEKRDLDNKLSPYLVGWNAIDDGVKQWDCDNVKRYPELLAQIGFLIVRRPRRPTSGTNNSISWITDQHPSIPPT